MPDWLRTTIRTLLAIGAAIIGCIASYIVCEIIFTLLTSIFGAGQAALLTLCVAIGFIVVGDTLMEEKVRPETYTQKEFIEGLRQQKKHLLKMTFDHFVRSGWISCLN